MSEDTRMAPINQRELFTSPQYWFVPPHTTPHLQLQSVSEVERRRRHSDAHGIWVRERRRRQLLQLQRGVRVAQRLRRVAQLLAH